MKRKLPQWLLDATNNNVKRPNSPGSIRKSSNESQNNIDSNSNQTKPEQHSNQSNAESDQIQRNGTVTLVPLANLLSPVGGGVQVNGPRSSIHTSENTAMNDEMRTTESNSKGIMPLPLVIKTETIDQIEPSASNVQNEQQPVVVKQEIKDEPVDPETSTTTPPTSTVTPLTTTVTPPTTTVTPPTLVPKIENVKPERRSCNYGIKCFR